LLGDEIGRGLGCLVLAAVIFWSLSKWVLPRIVHFFSVDGELLFIGTMAYRSKGCWGDYQTDPRKRPMNETY